MWIDHERGMGRDSSSAAECDLTVLITQCMFLLLGKQEAKKVLVGFHRLDVDKCHGPAHLRVACVDRLQIDAAIAIAQWRIRPHRSPVCTHFFLNLTLFSETVGKISARIQHDHLLLPHPLHG
jgi:hypothetical protein